MKDQLHATQSPGAGWVNRFLQPLLVTNFPGRTEVFCLQVSADDASEAEQLHELGHRCELTEVTASLELDVADASYDLIFTGRFPVMAKANSERVKLAKELNRTLRPGGAVLLVFGNRLCPLDLTRNGPLLHSLGSRRCLSLKEIRLIFLEEAGFVRFRPLNVCGHQGWNRLPISLRWVGKVLDAYWRRVATPWRSWVYFGPLNPTLAVWLNKD